MGEGTCCLKEEWAYGNESVCPLVNLEVPPANQVAHLTHYWDTTVTEPISGLPFTEPQNICVPISFSGASL
jgi:hypothetical protein